MSSATQSVVSNDSIEGTEAKLWAMLAVSGKEKLNLSDERMAQINVLWYMFYQKCCQIQRDEARLSRASGSSEPPSDEEVSRITEFARASRPAGTRPVIFVGAITFCVYMTDDQMINFDQFVSRVIEVYPDCNQRKDCLWQHWTTIRRAFQKFPI